VVVAAAAAVYDTAAAVYDTAAAVYDTAAAVYDTAAAVYDTPAALLPNLLPAEKKAAFSVILDGCHSHYHHARGDGEHGCNESHHWSGFDVGSQRRVLLGV
jgi:hypothetical protein